MSDTHQAVDSWIKQLSEQDMPVFSGTVTNVTDAINSDKSSAVDVAQMVLRDASLTGRLLKMANSVYFNPSRQQINTVSRAIMVLGFDQVRELTLSLLLVDSLSDGKHREQLIAEMASAFHAATQAQELAKKVKMKGAEDIFVATLLSNLGNMAFWAFSDEKGTELISLLANTDNPEEAEREVLGFRLSDLTKGLSKSWSLGELLDSYLHGRGTDERIKLIQLGKKLSVATLNGWQSDEALEAIDDVSEQLNLDVEELEQLVFANAKKAKEVTKLYGSYEASKKIPQPVYALSEDEDAEQGNEAEDTTLALNESDEAEAQIVEFSPYPQPDPAFQMTVMQEITNAIQERPSIGIILEMVLEGIHRGVGMDRALFAILNPERTHLHCKYALGENSDILGKELEIDIRRPENIFHKIIQNQQALMVPGDPRLLNGTIAKSTITLLGTPPYFVMPTIVKNKVIGLFLADRRASGREVTDQDFLSFQLFCQQANMGLSFLAMRG